MGIGELARVYARQGRLDKATEISEDVVQRLEASRGPEHPDTVYALHKLAQLYEMQMRYGEAAEHSRLALERSEARLTMEHPLARKIVKQHAKLRTLREGAQKDRVLKEICRTSSHEPQPLGYQRPNGEPQSLRLQTSKTF